MTLLTAAEFREIHPTDEIGDDPLNLLLDAAEAEIDRFAGPLTSATELHGGGNRFINLSRPAATITEITETAWSTVETLDPADYLLYPDGYSVERLATGPNGLLWWRGRVTVTYAPVDDAALRKVVQAGLAQLVIEYHPGVASETIGSWTQQYRQTTAAAADEHDALLALLSTGSGMVIVGDRGGYPLGSYYGPFG